MAGFGSPFASVPPRREGSFGDPPLAPKAIGLCFFWTVQSRCFRLARRVPSLSCEILGYAATSEDSASIFARGVSQPVCGGVI